MRTANMFATMMFLAIAVRGSVALCPDYYTELSTGCYHFGHEEIHSWEEAFEICRDVWHGYLVEIESQTEQDELVGFIRSWIDPPGVYSYWLGATDKEVPDQFRWMTSGNLMQFSAWRGMNPDNIGGNEECVAFQRDAEYLWSDFQCYAVDQYMQYQRALCETFKI